MFFATKLKNIVDFNFQIRYNANVKNYSEEWNMKKVLAVLMAVLMVFTSMSIMVFATGSGDNTIEIDLGGTEKEEKTTRNIVSDNGLVVPLNFKQLKFSVIFKLLEKFIKWVLDLFAGDKAGDVDQSIADDISSIGDEISSAIEEGSQFIEDNTVPKP